MFHAFLMDSRLYDRQFNDARYLIYNLIAIDEHGHGGTTGSRRDFTFRDTASDSLQLLTILGIDRFYVLGTSQGGHIAFHMALLEPQRIKGLILLGATAYAATEQRKVAQSKLRDKWCETKIPSEELLLVKAASFGGPTRVGERVYEKVKQMWIERYAGPDGYDPALNCLRNRDDLDDRLGDINVPALVLHGSDDQYYPTKDAKTWSSKLPNLWKFEIVEQGLHYLSFTEPGAEVCAKLIPEFIKQTL
ncbi:unnamed protein product [Didymodactylos carnosus]|uniref:AB hydrolase-1 domain-containing protein n=1 Tax=Didymodactylos carnosus TaxID=1234261 RepID=A0A816CSQ4_9BILA|nr:unnamed protein product [Didymodactylos carnosus]CAF1625676.1 unnamed protein product [Didymodactylos carnosus]CAF3819601.1 unnamed protein product [Didymodactylos carnosus]CAF4519377.1 unnamed protein product [Didymodactylos carnosus]